MSVSSRQQIDALLRGRRWQGDVLFTGTPQGVGQLHPGDRVVARLTGPNGAELVQN